MDMLAESDEIAALNVARNEPKVVARILPKLGRIRGVAREF
jgi:hypothetical protein